MKGKIVLMCLVMVMALAGSANAAAYSAITEGFTGTTGWDVIEDGYNNPNAVAVTSVDTGYDWYGDIDPGVSSWGIAFYNMPDPTVLANNVYDLPSGNENAWTIFGGDSVTNLAEVVFVFAASDADPNMPIEVIIQDSASNWFVSDANITAGSDITVVLDALSTTWRTIDAPVAQTPINVTGTGTPNLSSVLGGGINFLTAPTTGQGAVRIDSIMWSAKTVRLTETPSDGAVDIPLDQVLSWALTDPCDSVYVTGYDVYFDANEALVTSKDASVKKATNDPNTTYDPDIASLGTDYYWRVEPVLTGAAIAAGILPGDEVWSFTSITPAPMIVDFNSMSTSLEMLAGADAVLSTLVTDADDNIVSATMELLTDDYEYPAGASSTLTPDSISDFGSPFSWGATFTTDTAGKYKVRLTVADLQSNVAERVTQIVVYETDCNLAKAQSVVLNQFDFNEDCLVNIVDFALFAVEWLDDTSATEPIYYPSGPGWVPYIPFADGLLNPGFETGDFAGWWPGAGASITADANDGTYAATIAGEGEGMNSYTDIDDPASYWLPAGNHSLKLSYKGDLGLGSGELVIDLKGVMGQDPAPTRGDGVTPLVKSLVAGYTEMWVVETPTVASYTEYEIQFTVDTEGYGNFWIGTHAPVGTGYLDDFKLEQNTH